LSDPAAWYICYTCGKKYRSQEQLDAHLAGGHGGAAANPTVAADDLAAAMALKAELAAARALKAELAAGAVPKNDVKIEPDITPKNEVPAEPPNGKENVHNFPNESLPNASTTTEIVNVHNNNYYDNNNEVEGENVHNNEEDDGPYGLGVTPSTEWLSQEGAMNMRKTKPYGFRTYPELHKAFVERVAKDYPYLSWHQVLSAFIAKYLNMPPPPMRRRGRPPKPRPVGTKPKGVVFVEAPHKPFDQMTEEELDEFIAECFGHRDYAKACEEKARRSGRVAAPQEGA